MPKKICELIRSHLRGHFLTYLLLTVFFIGGIFAGAYVSTTYTQDQIHSLGSFLQDVMEIFGQGEIDYNEIFKASFFSSVQSMLLIWLLGFTIIGVPIILLLILKCGFMLGLISTFFISFYGYKGLLAAVLILLAQSIFYIPVLFVMSTYGLSLSSLLVRMMTGKIKYRANFKMYILQYVTGGVISAVVLVIYALFEAYIVANLLQWACQL